LTVVSLVEGIALRTVGDKNNGRSFDCKDADEGLSIMPRNPGALQTMSVAQKRDNPFSRRSVPPARTHSDAVEIPDLESLDWGHRAVRLVLGKP
jgi:hypothetical protein